MAHAWFDGLVWTIDATTFAVGAGGGSPDLALASGALRLAFQDDVSAARPFLAWAEWPSATAGPWSAPASIDSSLLDDLGENPAIAFSGGVAHVASFDVSNGAVRLAVCAAACTASGNWGSGQLVAFTGAELDLATNPVTGDLVLLYRDQVAAHTLAVREWDPAAPFSPGPSLPVMSAVGTISPSVALRIEPGGRRHVFAWTEAGGLLQLRHRYGFGIFVTDGNSPFAVQNLAPLPGPLRPLLSPVAGGPIEIGWAATAPLLPGAHVETRSPVF